MKISLENQSWINEVWEKLERKLSLTAVKSRDKIPNCAIDGMHDDCPAEKITRWTNGFWGGLMWLMYSATKKEDYKLAAEASGKRMLNAYMCAEKLDHDVGFMFHLLYGAEYNLTDSQTAKNYNLIASMMLSSRYEPLGGFIRAWNPNQNAVKDGWTIIDTMMNLPLLYWASKVTGDMRYQRYAIKHADMTMKDHVREDGSVNHIVVHNPLIEGEVIETRGGQGCAVGSSWSRGCSWAVYGFVLSYIHTGKKEYLKTAKKCADYFIEQSKKTDYLPRCDFRQPDLPMYYDSTAGVIACCGLIELSKILGDESYLDVALKILKKIEKDCSDFSLDTDFVVGMGMASYNEGIQKNIIYGDFFFAEAILKLKNNEFLPW